MWRGSPRSTSAGHSRCQSGGVQEAGNDRTYRRPGKIWELLVAKGATELNASGHLSESIRIRRPGLQDMVRQARQKRQATGKPRGLSNGLPKNGALHFRMLQLEINCNQRLDTKVKPRLCNG